MDETAIRLCPSQRDGHLSKQARGVKREARSVSMNATRAQMRGSMSLICFVCDFQPLQEILPHIVLVPRRFAPQRLGAELKNNAIPPRQIWIVDKAWMTTQLMVQVMTQLHQCFKKWSETPRMMLTADAFRAHIAPAVWRKMAQLGIHYLVIPPKVSWTLQPCDTRAFVKLKMRLGVEMQLTRARSLVDMFGVVAVVSALTKAVITTIVNGDYRVAFWELGLTGVQACVSQTLLDKLKLEGRPAVSHELPTMQDLQQCFPRGARIPLDDMFRVVLSDHPLRTATVTADAPASSDIHVMPQPWHGRLRSSSSLGDLVAEEQPFAEPWRMPTASSLQLPPGRAPQPPWPQPRRSQELVRPRPLPRARPPK